jgi:hypothetical protein
MERFSGKVTKTEDRLIEQVITEYYDVYFNGFTGFTPPQREDLRKSLFIDDRNNNINSRESDEERRQNVSTQIDEIESKTKGTAGGKLSFNYLL